jgi:hypothetical protein
VCLRRRFTGTSPPREPRIPLAFETTFYAQSPQRDFAALAGGKGRAGQRLAAKNGSGRRPGLPRKWANEP